LSWFFNKPEEEDLGGGDGYHLEVSRINGSLVDEREANRVSVIAEESIGYNSNEIDG